jgi:hypothetical protein
VAGRAADSGHHIVAYEPGLFGAERLVLRTDGRIVSLSAEEIARTLAGEQTP